MGKGGKKGKKKDKAAAELTEDELLDQAVAENKALREKEIAEGCPTKAALLASLDRVTLFDLRVVENGVGRQTCLSPSGDYIFYVDVADASKAMEARKLTHPGHLALGTTTLGRAFALTESKAFGFQTNVQFPMCLQGPTAVLRDLVNDGLDEGAKSLCTVREQLNPKSSTIPMFSFAELVEGTETAPHFFTKADLVHYWIAYTGKPQTELPTHLIMTDLRVLIVRMMTVPRDWKTLVIMPMASTVEILQGASASRAETAATEKGKAALEGVAEEQDEPPPLEGPPAPLSAPSAAPLAAPPAAAEAD